MIQPLFTQGMRTKDHAENLTWQDLLYSRLNCVYERLTTGSSTQEAEASLEIEPSVYYYVHRIHPSFSRDLIFFSVEPSLCCDVSPFDTGGLHKGVIVQQQHGKLTNAEFVREYSYPVPEYAERFHAWGKKSYSSVEEYVNGDEPAQGPAAPVLCKLGSCCDERLWTWEARVVKTQENASESLQPCQLLISPERTNQYFNWIQTNNRLSFEERKQHLRRVHQILRQTDDVLNDVHAYLRQMKVW